MSVQDNKRGGLCDGDFSCPKGLSFVQNHRLATPSLQSPMRPFAGSKPYPAAITWLPWGPWKTVWGVLVLSVVVVGLRMMLGGTSSGTQSARQGICLCPGCDRKYSGLGLEGSRFVDFPSNYHRTRLTLWRHRQTAEEGGCSLTVWHVWLDEAGSRVYQPSNRTRTNHTQSSGDGMHVDSPTRSDPSGELAWQ